MAVVPNLSQARAGIGLCPTCVHYTQGALPGKQSLLPVPLPRPLCTCNSHQPWPSPAVAPAAAQSTAGSLNTSRGWVGFAFSVGSLVGSVVYLVVIQARKGGGCSQQ